MHAALSKYSNTTSINTVIKSNLNKFKSLIAIDFIFSSHFIPRNFHFTLNYSILVCSRSLSNKKSRKLALEPPTNT